MLTRRSEQQRKSRLIIASNHIFRSTINIERKNKYDILVNFDNISVNRFDKSYSERFPRCTKYEKTKFANNAALIEVHVMIIKDYNYNEIRMS